METNLKSGFTFWGQVKNACKLQGGDVPLFCVDAGAGAHRPFEPEVYEHRVKYLADQMINAISKKWKCDGIILHYNRGCEGLSLGIAENRLGLLDLGYKVMNYEWNIGTEREFDEKAVTTRIDIFLDSIGLKRPE
jgi:hypothetical protein